MCDLNEAGLTVRLFLLGYVTINTMASSKLTYDQIKEREAFLRATRNDPKPKRYKDRPEYHQPRHKNKGQLVRQYLVISFLAALAAFSALHWYVWPAGEVWIKLVLALNMASFMLFGFDKTMARFENAGRLPERFFHIVALLGGSLGIIAGALVFRHKIRKFSFMWKIYLIIMLQIAIGCYVLSRLISF